MLADFQLYRSVLEAIAGGAVGQRLTLWLWI